ncbi:DUF1638 domain-containing protein [Aliiruegeria sabulilitoris]|uniref:DUF1638 domain-containing protein n=1 Tax=Aliiruegeria sabulilitoris TaxID=1510458 RepID=UPI000833CB65|nr:DUF1638 domain-containing protein [Aliiruegeria sabulilitoris]NDR54906.1 DUF1638 domain-containing protein [Pseudoruegeria sp. M32A2M]
MTLSDRDLTEEGLSLDAGGAARLLVIGCGAIAREILALKAANGWTHMDLACLPAILHNHPDRIAPAVEAMIKEKSARYEAIFVAYADCGTGGLLEEVCKRHGVEMIAGPHCYSFYEGNTRFAERAADEIDSFYLTDFLVRQFDAFVWRPLGLDRHPELIHSYFAHYRRLVYQAQVDDPALDVKAEECATRLGLAYERRKTGYGDLATALAAAAGATGT